MLKHLEPTRELDVLSEVSRMLTQFDMQRVLGKVVRLLASTVGATRAHLELDVHYELDWRQIFQTDRLDADTVFSAHVGILGSGLFGWVAQGRQAVLIKDIQNDPAMEPFKAQLRGAGSAIAVPLLANRELMGVLLLQHPELAHFSDSDMRLVNIAMNQTSVAVYSARLEAHVRSGKHQLDSVLHAVNSLMLLVDKAGLILMMNAATAKYLGLADPMEALGKSLRELAADDGAFTEVLALIQNPTSDLHWLLTARSESRKRSFEVMVSVWENPLQAQSGYVLMFHDVTTLHELDRFRTDMLRMASHDLRSPLALIAGYCDLATMELKNQTLAVPAMDYINSIRRTTERMDELLGDLLRLDRFQSAQSDLLESVSLQDFLQALMDHTLLAAQPGQHTITTNFYNLPAMLNGDPAMLREAMDNLVSNAIKYTPPGGKIQIDAYSANNCFYFAVNDNGIGISQEYQPKLFKSFFRVRQPGTERIPGTGLGLSLVKAVAERHGGDVWVESESGIGSQFGFWIPLR
jgi:PAS domain S-box-containing protein